MKRALPWVVTLAASAAAVALVATRPAQLPTYEAVRADYRPSEAWLLDRNGDVLDSRRIDLGVRRLAWTPLEAISPALSDTIVEREDRRFAQHRGVDWRATAGALRDTLQGRRRGASTLTMQLAALLDAERDGHRHRGLGGKLRQARLALQLESRWTKPQILEAYLNLLPFRGELQGIGAAAWMLAGKTPAGLTRDESLVFAALLPHPSARAESVARRACAGLPADCDALAITARRLLARAPRQPLTESLAPHLAASLLRRAGERRTTTLDREVQRVASAALTRQLDGLSGRNVRDGAALVVDNATGDVLAYVGSAGRTSTASAVDGVRARRQAGSTLKPFLYGLALERRYLTAASLLDDSPVSIDTATGLYLPRDYDHRYKGAVSVRTALAGSLNVPAVRALQLVGVEPFRERLNDLGYASIDQDGAYYGFALALGSAEVSLWEQASAFRSLALQGQGSDLRVLPDDVPAPLRSVASPAAAFVIADILSDRAARAITFGLDSSLATPYWSAV
ncbi:MAG: transglycosylase domain-containing protein, partial [Steroidobacteraceae bacterium]